MFDDTIIADVRRVRKEIEDECGNDPRRIYEYIQSYQEQFKDRLINQPFWAILGHCRPYQVRANCVARNFCSTIHDFQNKKK